MYLNMLETMQNIMGFDIIFVYSLRHFKYSGCVGMEPGVRGGGKTLNFFYYAFCLTDAPNQ